MIQIFQFDCYSITLIVQQQGFFFANFALQVVDNYILVVTNNQDARSDLKSLTFHRGA